MYCKSCGKKNEDGGLFCIYCGQAIETQEKLEVQDKLKKESLREPKEEAQEAIVSEPKQKRKLGKLPKIVGAVLLLCVIGAGTVAYMNANKVANALYEENYNMNVMVLFEYTDWNEEIGNLYLQEVGAEKRLIAENIQGGYKYIPEENRVIYTNKNKQIYALEIGEQPIKIIENATILENTMASPLMTDSNRYFGYITDKGEETTIHIYDIIDNRDVFTTQNTDLSFDINSETGFIHYVENGKFYIQTPQEKLFIAQDVYSMKNIDKNIYLYKQEQANTPWKIVYVTEKQFKEESIEDIEYIDMTTVETTMDGDAIYFIEREYIGAPGRLHIKLKNQQSVVIAANVENYVVTKENDVYYEDDNGGVNLLSIGEINKKYLEDRTYFTKWIERLSPEQIMTEGYIMQRSADGKSLLIETENDAYLYKDKQCIKLMDDLRKIRVFNDYIVYIKNETQLYRQSTVLKGKEMELQEPVLIADQVLDYHRTPYGSLLVYETKKSDEKVTVYSYNQEDGSKLLIEDVSMYDMAMVGPYTYYKYLEIKDIVGSYYCEEDGFLVKISEEGTYTAYMGGEEIGSVTPVYNFLDRNTANLNYEEYFMVDYGIDTYILLDGYTSLTLQMNGECTMKLSDESSYKLVPISEEVFSEKLAAQKIEEEERQRNIEQGIKYEVMQEAIIYYEMNGISLPPRTPIYSDHSYSATQSYYTTRQETWEIFDSYIDLEVSLIWVKIKFKLDTTGEVMYGWIPESIDTN